MIKTCKRCGVTIIGDRVVFSFRPDLSATHEELSRKVCQWAHRVDKRDGKVGSDSGRAVDCSNPLYNPDRSYGSFDDGTADQLGIMRNDAGTWVLPDE